MANKHMERCSNSIVIKDMQIQTTKDEQRMYPQIHTVSPSPQDIRTDCIWRWVFKVVIKLK